MLRFKPSTRMLLIRWIKIFYKNTRDNLRTVLNNLPSNLSCAVLKNRSSRSGRTIVLFTYQLQNKGNEVIASVIILVLFLHGEAISDATCLRLTTIFYFVRNDATEFEALGLSISSVPTF